MFHNGEGRGRKERRKRERVGLKGSEGQEGVRDAVPEATAHWQRLWGRKGFGVLQDTSLVSGSL